MLYLTKDAKKKLNIPDEDTRLFPHPTEVGGSGVMGFLYSGNDENYAIYYKPYDAEAFEEGNYEFILDSFAEAGLVLGQDYDWETWGGMGTNYVITINPACEKAVEMATEWVNFVIDTDYPVLDEYYASKWEIEMRICAYCSSKYALNEENQCKYCKYCRNCDAKTLKDDDGHCFGCWVENPEPVYVLPEGWVQETIEDYLDLNGG